MKLKVKVGENGLMIWNVNAECRKLVQPVAKEFGLTVEQFLERKTQGRLPAQIPARGNGMKEFTEADANRVKLNYECADPVLSKRIERASEFGGHRSVNAFVIMAVMGMVECLEDDMLLSPETGKPICDEGDLWAFQSFEKDPLSLPTTAVQARVLKLLEFLDDSDPRSEIRLDAGYNDGSAVEEIRALRELLGGTIMTRGGVPVTSDDR